MRYQVTQDSADASIWNVVAGARLVCSRSNREGAEAVAAWLNRPVTEEEMKRSSDYIEPLEVDVRREEGIKAGGPRR